MIHITYHAGQRFLERVMNNLNCSKYETHRTVEYLQRVFKDIVPSSYTSHLPVPGFENSFNAVFKGNSIVTIIPREKIKRKRTKNV